MTGQMLKDTKIAPGFSMTSLAEATQGHSGSDLRELCRSAAMVPVREFMRTAEGNEELLAKGQLEVCNFLRSLASLLILLSCRASIFGH